MVFDADAIADKTEVTGSQPFFIDDRKSAVQV